MTVREFYSLEPGDRLRIKRGYINAGMHVTFRQRVGPKLQGRRITEMIEVGYPDGSIKVASHIRFSITKKEKV